MPHSPTTLDARDFERHADWLRRLARRLVDDADVADDLVQETWLRAVVHRPGRHQPLRAWLTTVARSLARFHARGDRNRRRREERVAHDELQDASPADLLERTEQLRIVVDALLSLDEPYRSTLLLHFQEGLGGKEIAERTGITDATARWRLKAGLDRLRTTLDARSGDRRTWVAALAPLAKSRPATTASGFGAAGWIAALLVVAVVSVTVWHAWRPAAPGEHQRVEAPPSQDPPAAAEPLDFEPSGTDPIARTQPPVDPAPTDTVVPAPSQIDVSGRVIDDSGAAVPGATVKLFVRTEEGLCESAGVRDHTDDDGRFSLAVDDPDDRDLLVFATASGRATAEAEWRSDGQVTLRLPRAGVVFGRVLEFESRQPIEGATLVFGYEHFEGPAGAYQWRGGVPTPISTAVGGAYRFDHAPLDMDLDISVVRPGYARHSQRITLVDANTELDILVPHGFDLSGVVIDAETETPLAGAMVLIDGGSKRCVTDDDRAFSARGLQTRELDLHVMLDGYALTLAKVSSAAVDGPARIPVVRTCDARGTILDANGDPIADAFVTAKAHGPSPSWPLGEHLPALADERLFILGTLTGSSANADASGRFHLAGLAPHARYLLQIRVGGAAGSKARRAWIEPLLTLAPGSTTAVTLRAQTGGAIEGTATLGGQPARIAIRWSAGSLRGTAWAEDGAYRIDGAPPGTVELSAHVRSALRERQSVVVTAGETTRCDFDLPDIRTVVAGHVLTASGAPCPKVSVKPIPPSTWSAWTDDDGAFSTEIAIDAGTPITLEVTHDPYVLRDFPAIAGRDDLMVRFPQVVDQPLRIVDDATGDPIPRALVRWEPAADSTIECEGDHLATPGPGGVSTVPLPEGTGVLHVDARRLGYAEQRVEVDVDAGDPEPLEIRLRRAR